MSAAPTVSVIIPSYNRAEWLPATVESVLAQTHPAAEILIIDDGSTDNTAEVCTRFPAPVRYLRQRNAGVGAARNHGMREARSEFIALVDSDDLWEPTKLAVQMALHRLRPEIGWSVTNATTIGLDGVALPGGQGFERNFSLFDGLGVGADEFFARWFERVELEAAGSRHVAWCGDAFAPLFLGNFTSPTCAVLARSLVERVGGFDESFRLAEETEYFHRVAAYAQLGVITTPLFRWRVGQPVSLVSAQNVVTLIQNALTSGERAAKLRTPLPPAAQVAQGEGRRRLLTDLAYTQLSLTNGHAARAAVRDARQAGARGTRLALISALGLLPAPALTALHALKRRFR